MTLTTGVMIAGTKERDVCVCVCAKERNKHRLLQLVTDKSESSISNILLNILRALTLSSLTDILSSREKLLAKVTFQTRVFDCFSFIDRIWKETVELWGTYHLSVPISDITNQSMPNTTFWSWNIDQLFHDEIHWYFLKDLFEEIFSDPTWIVLIH